MPGTMGRHLDSGWPLWQGNTNEKQSRWELGQAGEPARALPAVLSSEAMLLIHQPGYSLNPFSDFNLQGGPTKQL